MNRYLRAFAEGMLSVFDLSGTAFLPPRWFDDRYEGRRRERENLRSDWKAVGDDMRKVIDRTKERTQ